MLTIRLGTMEVNIANRLSIISFVEILLFTRCFTLVILMWSCGINFNLRPGRHQTVRWMRGLSFKYCLTFKLYAAAVSPTMFSTMYLLPFTVAVATVVFAEIGEFSFIMYVICVVLAPSLGHPSRWSPSEWLKKENQWKNYRTQCPEIEDLLEYVVLHLILIIIDLTFSNCS